MNKIFSVYRVNKSTRVAQSNAKLYDFQDLFFFSPKSNFTASKSQLFLSKSLSAFMSDAICLWEDWMPSLIATDVSVRRILFFELVKPLDCEKFSELTWWKFWWAFDFMNFSQCDIASELFHTWDKKHQNTHRNSVKRVRTCEVTKIEKSFIYLF